MPLPASIPGVVDVHVVRGARAPRDSAPDLVIEIPHGATRTADYRALEELLSSALPPGLVDFFHVNTDAGAPELGDAVARAFAEAWPTRSVAVLRSRIPRTFIDCNRRIDASAAELEAGRVTPGLMPWITAASDRQLLRDRHDAYVGAVRGASASLAPDGAMLLLHTYAPRSVDVEVDERIVESLHRAYGPELEPTWPLRPEVDVIGRTLEGVSLAPEEVVRVLVEALARDGITVVDGVSYPLHPSTLAWEHVTGRPGRALCLEVRRDLLADPFEPFVEMKIGAAKVARIAAPLAEALGRWWRR
jgi:predicted N-formylglutamate amidohydrolase